MSHAVEKKSEDFLPYARPWISEEAIQDVVACLKSGWITTGPKVAQFEKDLAAYCDAPTALTVTSATAGLFLALRALDLKEGDEVITTPMTFVCTANVIVQAGGRPVFVDIEEGTYNMDVSKLEAAITPRTRAVVPVHFDGLPVDLDPLYEIAKKHHLTVIEDAAHAIGTSYKGRKIGSFGDVQVFSFHPNKNMTSGEGGCMTLRDEGLAKRIKVDRFHGIDRDAFNRFAKGGSQHYDVIMPGFKFNMMDLQAAIGIHQLKALDTFIERRRVLAKRYKTLLEGIKGLALPQTPPYDHEHAWHQFAVTVHPEEAGMDRDQFMDALKEHNVGTGLQFLPVHLFTFYREAYGTKPGDFPIAEKVGRNIVSLPLFPAMTDEDQSRVVKAIRKVLGDGR